MERLQYLDIGNNYIPDIDIICDDSFGNDIKYMILTNNPIQDISECVYNYWSESKLKQLDLSLIDGSFKTDLLIMPEIMELNVFGTDITMNSFDNDDEIEYKQDIRYYLQNNPICNEFMNYSNSGRIDEYSESLYLFLENSKGCIDNNYCDFSNEFEYKSNKLCQPKLWNNGVCDIECNVASCSFDHDDCSIND